MRKQSLAKLSALGLLAFATIGARAATITVNLLPTTGTDAASGISTGNTYTHRFDFGANADGSAATVNGVTFTKGLDAAAGGAGAGVQETNNPATLTDSASGKTLSLSRTGATGFQGTNLNGTNQSPSADGNMFTLLDGFGLLLGPPPSGSTWTFTFNGLTAGTAYSTRFYGFAWTDAATARTIQVSTNADGSASSQTFEFNDPDGNATNDGPRAFHVDVNYTLSSGTSAAVTMTVQDANNGPHIGAVTNQVVVPEPSACVMLLSGVGFLGLLRRIRRS